MAIKIKYSGLVNICEMLCRWLNQNHVYDNITRNIHSYFNSAILSGKVAPVVMHFPSLLLPKHWDIWESLALRCLEKIINTASLSQLCSCVLTLKTSGWALVLMKALYIEKHQIIEIIMQCKFKHASRCVLNRRSERKVNKAQKEKLEEWRREEPLDV